MAFYLRGLERDVGIFFWDFSEHRNTQTELRNSVRSELATLESVANPGEGTAGQSVLQFSIFEIKSNQELYFNTIREISRAGGFFRVIVEIVYYLAFIYHVEGHPGRFV